MIKKCDSQAAESKRRVVLGPVLIHTVECQEVAHLKSQSNVHI